MTENTSAMKKIRAYNRLLCAVIEQKPKTIIDGLLTDYVDWSDGVGGDGKTFASFEEIKKQVLDSVKKDAENYFTHAQGGKIVLVHKNSPLGKILAKGKYVPG